MKLPRVLVISPTSIGSQAATGITMTSFFRGWPRESLAQIHSDKHGDFDVEVCDKYYFLESPLEGLRKFPVFGRILPFLWGDNGIFSEYINFGNLLSWVRQFRPDLIYYRMIDRPMFYWWLPLKLARLLEIPLVTHIMDDWPARSEAAGGVAYKLFFKSRLRESLNKLLSLSAANLSISEKMSKAFKLRYGVEFIPFHNSIDIAQWRDLENHFPSFHPARHFRIVYAGSLAPDMQLHSLKDIAEVVSDLFHKGMNVSLVIYSAEWWLKMFRKHFMGMPAVRFATFAPRTEYPRILAEADLLVLPVNFDKASLRYIRYSMANKAPECMASGTPILVYGPSSSVTVEYASSAGWAHVVSKRSRKQLQNALLDLLSSRQKRMALAKRARKLAFMNHDAVKERRRFRALLTSVFNQDINT